MPREGGNETAVARVPEAHFRVQSSACQQSAVQSLTGIDRRAKIRERRRSAMEAKREMTVRGEPAAIKAWIRTLSAPVAGAWSRATEIERKRKLRPGADWPICLVWSGEDGHPKTAVFLGPVSDSEVAVKNLVPMDRNCLSPDDRRAVLEAFRTALIVRAEGRRTRVRGKSLRP